MTGRVDFPFWRHTRKGPREELGVELQQGPHYSGGKRECRVSTGPVPVIAFPPEKFFFPPQTEMVP